MPKFPHFATRVSQIQGAAFERYREQLLQKGKDLVRLHIGDTYLQPIYPIPFHKKFITRYTDFNRYCDTFGVNDLRHVLRDKLNTDNDFSVNESNILITNGATNALSAAVMSTVEQDEDVLLLTPCWPLFQGIVKSAQANVIEIPFYMHLYDNPDLEIKKYLDQHVTKKSVALYLNSPNNPSGMVLTRKQLLQIAQFAKENDLWVISDEAYEGLTFDGIEHISIASLPLISDRTIAVYTFSKIFMFAGLRLGYAIAEPHVIANLNKIIVYQIYSPATFSQQMMIDPIKKRHQWMPTVQAHYQQLRDIFVNDFKYPFFKPQATYFIFFSLKDLLKYKRYADIINACFDAGVSVAPGEDFGGDYHDYIRLCFTGEEPQRLKQGISRLNRILQL